MRRLRGVMPAALAMAMASASPAGAADACPAALAQATRLVLVVTPDMRSVTAALRRFERASPAAAWTAVGKPEPAVVGKGGLGWGWTFAAYAQNGEPAKREGDKRAPAGFYPLGRPFGLSTAALPGYLRLQPGQSYCVDDVGSSAYGTIVPRAAAGAQTSGEAMWTVPLYRRGLLVDYPANRDRKAGSCVFVHVWRGPESGTAGCVALAEAGVKGLQDWAKPGTAAIGILPKSALDRFAGCLKGVSPPS